MIKNLNSVENAPKSKETMVISRVASRL